ncbi:guanylate kinase [bacterium]|nr:guanylate kinase [bacterium]
MNTLFIITGPSGGGKSTLVHEVMKKMSGLQFSVSHTTRKKRKGEKEGKDYYFLSKKKFEQMIREKKMVEWARVHGDYYGTSQKEMERKKKEGDLILDIDIQGAQQIKEQFGKVVFVFIMPPGYEELKKRLENRAQENEVSIQKRLESAEKEITHYSEFDYVVINDHLRKAADELGAIITARRCHLDIQEKKIQLILRSFISHD